MSKKAVDSSETQNDNDKMPIQEIRDRVLMLTGIVLIGALAELVSITEYVDYMLPRLYRACYASQVESLMSRGGIFEVATAAYYSCTDDAKLLTLFMLAPIIIVIASLTGLAALLASRFMRQYYRGDDHTQDRSETIRNFLIVSAEAIIVFTFLAFYVMEPMLSPW